ncbi:MAG TPA: alpha/beta hydrolase, partial [Actinomycetota bacterium]|nr:alpha/beta hydrolase [Actinomycetota bacterium]
GHHAYSKRVMAADMVQVMAGLGFGSFAVAGHDRGGRVAYRMALDHPAVVTRLAVFDIVPTHVMWQRMDSEFAMATYHWLFLAQPGGLPEKLIGADPAWWVREKLRRWAADPDAFAPEALEEYVRCFSDPAAIHASCEDYRAGATVDDQHDTADLGRRIACPVLALWGDDGIARRAEDPLAAWRPWCDDVTGHGVPGGHFLPEESPAEVLRAMLEVLLSR